MRVFLSYSLNQTELYIISVLTKLFNEKGYYVNASYTQDNFTNTINFNQFNTLLNSNLLIGIITKDSKEKDRVLEEWNVANINKVPALLLIEDKIPLNPEFVNHPNIIKFNRKKPDAAINEIKGKISNAKSSNNFDENLAWLFGGLGLLALVGLFSKK